MWFKNLLIYRFSQPLPFNESELLTALEKHPARPCASQETQTLGWTTPFGKHSENLLQVAQSFWLVAMRSDERILPSSVVREALNEKVEEIEQRDARKVYRKERDTLKDEVMLDLLPRAFTRSRTTLALLAPQHGWIAVDTSSHKRAEELLNLMRESTGSLPVRPINVKIAPMACMTDWVRTQQAPEGLVIADECELRDTGEDGGTVKCKRQDLGSDEIQQHLDAGKQVSQLALHWRDKLSLVLDDKLGLRRLKFEELLQEQADEQGGEDMAGQLDATLLIMAETLAELIPSLGTALGGEEIPQGI
ncbi:recombination-associated protein RdgC [Halopseudomonas yangmingensis]|uniref:Recombination-associated protein RdgC n=1 Tax=Halopseudomonas yangmingensis TaxID=1720063 RepID=A0A1I4NJI8_9GAMM|nr:recombination-associated protein RdgC [Halopseudomonas yangmingensis]SFM15631.1 recombination associated protein RdgC [Halopseudomonas yangmingensis]